MAERPTDDRVVFRHDHDVDLDALAALFRSVGWGARGGEPAALARVIAGSRWVVSAWDAGALIDGSPAAVPTVRAPGALPSGPSGASTPALVGFARAISDGVTTAYVTDVVVAETHRRRGVATGLMRALLEGRDTIQFVLRADPELAPFYRSLGFGDPDRMLRRPRVRR